MSKYTRKQQIPKQDEFVSFWQRLAERVEPHAIHVGIVLLSAFAAWLVGWFVLGHYEHRNENAALELGKIAAAYNEEIGDSPTKELERLKGNKSDEAETPHFKTADERTKVTLQKLDEFDKKFGGAKALDDAELLRAGVLYDAARFDEAAAHYEKLSHRDLAPSLLALAREGVGICAEARDKLDDALKAYQQLEPKQGTLFLDQALYDQARVQLKKGDRKKAAALYQDLLKRVPTSPLKEEVQNRVAGGT